jgi:SAM-dependent methyltransferase
MVAVPREVPPAPSAAVQDRELAYYENAYRGYIPGLFAKPAIVQFRRYLVERMLRATGAGAQSRILSIGCGIGDTELLLAPRVAHITGVDLSPTAIAEARRTSAARDVTNVRFVTGSWQTALPTDEPVDIVIAIFFLHHLPAENLTGFAAQLTAVLRKGGTLYALDPSARRLSGFVGELFAPTLMKKYQTENERPLVPGSTAARFRAAGFETSTRWFDFISTPLAGLFPSWATGFRLARFVDEGLTRLPLGRELSSNFELIARIPSP